MSYFEVFGVLTGVGVRVLKLFGAGVLKRGAGAESESEKCDSAHLWFRSKVITEPEFRMDSGRSLRFLPNPEKDPESDF